MLDPAPSPDERHGLGIHSLRRLVQPLRQLRAAWRHRARRGRQKASSLPLCLCRHLPAVGSWQRSALFGCLLSIGSSCVTVDTPLCSLLRVVCAPLAAPTYARTATPSPLIANGIGVVRFEFPLLSNSHARRASDRTIALHIPLRKGGGEPKRKAGRWGVFTDGG